MSTATSVQVRPAEITERDAIRALWEECGLSLPAPDEWEALMTGDTAAVLVAEDGGRIVGTAIASFDGWRAYLYHVAVASGQRRRGIGHRLMEVAEQYLLSSGARYAWVAVDQEQPDALALVASEGYLPEGEMVLVKRLATRVS